MDCLKDTAQRHLRGFTLVELLAVIILVSILSAVVTPVFGTIDRLREQALVRETARSLERARSVAMSGGNPCGVRFDLGNQVVELLTIPVSGAAPELLTSATGGAATDAAGAITSSLPGTSIDAIDIGGTGSDTIWFDFEGTPHTRTGAGTFVAVIPADATIDTSGGHTITIRRSTGLIEQ